MSAWTNSRPAMDHAPLDVCVQALDWCFLRVQPWQHLPVKLAKTELLEYSTLAACGTLVGRVHIEERQGIANDHVAKGSIAQLTQEMLEHGLGTPPAPPEPATEPPS